MVPPAVTPRVRSASPLRRLAAPVLVALALVAGACNGNGLEPGPDEGPRDEDDIVQHLVDPPAYPAPVTDDAELAELRNPEGTNRHQAYLAELEEDGTLDGALVEGSMLHVAAGVVLTVPEGASTAPLADGEVPTIAEVTACPAPCEVTGPALVAPLGWLSGIGVTADWELVVPAPAE